VPEDLVDFLRNARRGRLNVYLGMAAGVGKTVAMLREAKRLRAEGIDVVIGILETHGRAETAAEMHGLEVVPRRKLAYRGVELEEMDLPAVLARKPQVVLVDELAHTNVTGSENDKRYEDVDALRDAGITVLGTLNVQHLESLHDIVLRETGIDVRERVPDRFLAAATEIVVIDLSPADLQERLRQGKIYAREKVDRALEGFFRFEKLTALRQLALREVANRVELRARAPVADAERVMVCMSSQPTATARLLRHGARLSGGLNSTWFVVYVRTHAETPERIDSGALRSLAENIRLAKELGAEVVKLEGEDIVEALASFATERGITHVVFGRTRLPAWRERLTGSVVDKFMRRAPGVDVLVVGAREDNTP
jgi:two-component system sensor histidine kinase KdpD